MDIARLSTGLAQNNTLTEVGTAMLAKSLDQAEQTGAAMTKLIDSASLERSVNPNIGSNIDIYV